MADAVQVQATIDPAQVARMERVLTELQTVLGKDCFQAVMYAAVHVGRSGAKRSKPAKQYRDRMENPFFRMTEKRRALFDAGDGSGWPGKRWMIRVEEQPPKTGYVWYTNNPNDPMRTVPRRGLQRNIWSTLMGMAASTKGQTMQSGTGDKRWARFRVFQNTNVTVAAIQNLLQYFTDAYGEGALTEIYEAATRALNYKINAAVGVTVDRGNRA